ncbi:GyrI-like domain-containing protein [Prosthecodimorpha staleyi]|uniref:GyrI-like domain-containing protein n=1 Tax=Prosthecodimorpha staleyi TaxID=2840188 RepID=A0A947GCR0_9HYPH|nr:GyrI-like domain-containing protein [Prosthecodimorpha staleyi]MBT9289461.1 GyrI-like domain-containing protein [Prosthecodimorpha staleyi]
MVRPFRAVSAVAVAIALSVGGSAVAQTTTDTPPPSGQSTPAPTPPPAATPETSKEMQSPADVGKADAHGDITLAPPESVTLTARPVLFVTGKSTWDDAEEGIGNAVNAIFAAIAKGNLKAAGSAMIEYLDSGDEEFQFKAMVPIEAAPAKAPGKDVKVGQSPAGPALKFVHQGAFEDLEEVYNRIDDFLVAKSLNMKKVYEEYVTDPTVTAPEKMITNIYVVTE